jgi:hypothetical protein
MTVNSGFTWWMVHLQGRSSVMVLTVPNSVLRTFPQSYSIVIQRGRKTSPVSMSSKLLIRLMSHREISAYQSNHS